MHADMEQECGRGHIAWVEYVSESAKKEGKKQRAREKAGVRTGTVAGQKQMRPTTHKCGEQMRDEMVR